MGISIKKKFQTDVFNYCYRTLQAILSKDN